MKRPIFLNLMWHMHQPYYRDPVSGISSLPWVRLHGTKDYLDMVLLLEEYPKIKSTFNLVPSLIRQIEEYTQLGLSDVFLDLSRAKAADLGEEERQEILTKFFMANHENMVEIYPRYRQLLQMRGNAAGEKEMAEAARKMTSQDFLDLQVWFNLAWFDPYLRQKDDSLSALVEKDHDFSEGDKAHVLEKQMEILRAIVPQYRRLQRAGQIEITTTPFFHPILPLLCDTDIARVGMPQVNLPLKRFSHPEDAAIQVSRAIAFYRECFGENPRGMWPSEGSVSEEVLGLLAGQGLEWAATDEEILFQSLSLSQGVLNTAEKKRVLYQPYFFEKNGRRLRLVFRDHRLSDNIGFVYSRWNPRDAAANLVHQLLEIQEDEASGANPLVSIILDGENAWEYYPQDGLYFFRELYQMLSEEDRIITVTPAEYFKQYPEAVSLKKIFPGSWINHNFGIWLGHFDDNKSWEYLGQARDDLAAWEQAHLGAEDQALALKAWESIYIAEGSDWNWWFGDDHTSGNDEEFDRLYRQHLANVYKTLELDTPNHLLTPIPAARKFLTLYEEPVGLFTPVIDGEDTFYYEWHPAGHMDTEKIGGAMHQAEPLVTQIYFGFDLKAFYLRLDLRNVFEQGNEEYLKKVSISVKFLAPREITARITFPQGISSSCVMECHFPDGDIVSGGTFQCVGKTCLEAALPFQSLGFNCREKATFCVFAFEEGRELEQWPPNAPFEFLVPSEEYSAGLWSA